MGKTLFAAAALAVVLSAQGRVDRASRSAAGLSGDADSTAASSSADGRFTAFVSAATNLVPGDVNGRRDVFVFDRAVGTIERISVSSIGVPHDRDATGTPMISADGRFVAFTSPSSMLVPADTNGVDDVFVRDRLLGTTRRVSVPAASEANGPSVLAALSNDGGRVLFQSAATNLVVGDTNGRDDLFVVATVGGAPTRVSVGTGNVQGDAHARAAALSPNGRWVAFQTATGLFDAYDQNGVDDVYVRDLQSGVTLRASVSASGGSPVGACVDPAVADDGSVAFRATSDDVCPGDANGIDDIVVRRASATLAVSVAPGGAAADGLSASPSISADGRFVAFASAATNLVAGDFNGIPDVFVRDTVGAWTVRVSVDAGGVEAASPIVCNPFFGCLPLVLAPSIAAGGRTVVYEHVAPNLTPVNDVDFIRDVFAVDVFPRVVGVYVSPVSADLLVESPDDPGVPYLGGLSFGYRPGIAFGAATVPLLDDALLAATLGLSAPPVVGFAGILSATGTATASFPRLVDPSLSGIVLRWSCALLDPASSFGVRALMNAAPIPLGP